MRLQDRLIFGFLALLDRLWGSDLREREPSRREAQVAQHEARLQLWRNGWRRCWQKIYDHLEGVGIRVERERTSG